MDDSFGLFVILGIMNGHLEKEDPLHHTETTDAGKWRTDTCSNRCEDSIPCTLTLKGPMNQLRINQACAVLHYLSIS